MNAEKLGNLLKTTDGLQAMLNLLNGVFYNPKVTFWGGKVDQYTMELRHFVDQVLGLIPKDNHQKVSGAAVEAFMSSGGTLEQLKDLAQDVEAEERRAELIQKLRDRCNHLLTNPTPEEV